MVTEQSNPVTLIVLGGGQRGVVYANYALHNPHLAKVVAVADPREARRKIFARQHQYVLLEPSRKLSQLTSLQPRRRQALQ